MVVQTIRTVGKRKDDKLLWKRLVFICPLKIETRLAGDILGRGKNKYKRNHKRISLGDPWNHEWPRVEDVK